MRKLSYQSLLRKCDRQAAKINKQRNEIKRLNRYIEILKSIAVRSVTLSTRDKTKLRKVTRMQERRAA